MTHLSEILTSFRRSHWQNRWREKDLCIVGWWGACHVYHYSDLCIVSEKYSCSKLLTTNASDCRHCSSCRFSKRTRKASDSKQGFLSTDEILPWDTWIFNIWISLHYAVDLDYSRKKGVCFSSRGAFAGNTVSVKMQLKEIPMSSVAHFGLLFHFIYSVQAVKQSENPLILWAHYL